jgi:hypothetical protein
MEDAADQIPKHSEDQESSDLDIKAITSLSHESKGKVSYPTQYSHFDSSWSRPRHPKP